MKFKLAIFAVISITFPMNSLAAIINNDTYTTDTISGLDWLDLSKTSNRSYSDISAKFGTGNEFAGWRYATLLEIEEFWTAFGGNNTYYNGSSTHNNGLFEIIAPLWGDLYCIDTGCDIGTGFSRIISGDAYDSFNQSTATMGYHSSVTDYFDSNGTPRTILDTNPWVGSALVRSTVIPVPAAVWLFASGILGLLGVCYRKPNILLN